MTTITFKENIKINKESISIFEFIDILKDNGFIPELKELKNISEDVMKDYEESLKSNSRINI